MIVVAALNRAGEQASRRTGDCCGGVQRRGFRVAGIVPAFMDVSLGGRAIVESLAGTRDRTGLHVGQAQSKRPFLKSEQACQNRVARIAGIRTS